MTVRVFTDDFLVGKSLVIQSRKSVRMLWISCDAPEDRDFKMYIY
eukprot:COSAG02_NODE_13_length_57813_cov_14.298276_16_plen_45_part_00